MDAETSRPCVVAGYDGSPASRAAVSLAVAHARPDGRIIVVHVIAPPVGRSDGVAYQQALDAAFDRALAVTANLAEEVPGLGSVEWSTRLVAGPVAGGLADVAETERATEIVVGTRGLGRARALLGSVAHDLLHRAPCPVTVIPRRAVPEPAAG